MGRGERRCTRKGGKCFGRVTEKITRGNENKCLVKREDRKAAAADKIVNTYIRYGREGMFFMMALLYNWVSKTSTHVGDR